MENNPYQPATAELMSTQPTGGSRVWRIVRNVLIGFGVLFGLIIALLIWAGISTSMTYSKFEGVAEPFIVEFLNAQNPWDYDKARPLISEAWLALGTDEKNRKLFNYFNKLGSMESVQSIELQGCFSRSGTDGPLERCDYIVNAKYAAGDAQIHFGLSMESERLRLMQLNVNSNAFFQ